MVKDRNRDRRVLAVLLLLCGCCTQAVSQATSTDLYVSPGSDFVRPGLFPRSNMNIGIGHVFTGMSKYRIGNEPTLNYTYENAGTHGYWNSSHGSHTMALGVMKNLPLFYKGLGVYTTSQVGLTSMTGYPKINNRLYSGAAFGVTMPVAPHQSVWFQESYTKVATVPWYTSTSLTYVVSW